MTVTLASVISALFGSVMRPVSDASADCASSPVENTSAHARRSSGVRYPSACLVPFAVLGSLFILGSSAWAKLKTSTSQLNPRNQIPMLRAIHKPTPSDRNVYHFLSQYFFPAP